MWCLIKALKPFTFTKSLKIKKSSDNHFTSIYIIQINYNFQVNSNLNKNDIFKTLSKFLYFLPVWKYWEHLSTAQACWDLVIVHKRSEACRFRAVSQLTGSGCWWFVSSGWQFVQIWPFWRVNFVGPRRMIFPLPKHSSPLYSTANCREKTMEWKFK